MNELQIKGKFKVLLPAESGISKSGNDWKKQSFVIETESGNYPKIAAFEIWGDATDHVQNIKQDQEVTVKFTVESREYNGRYFTSLKATTVEIKGKSHPEIENPSDLPMNDTPVENDLPF